MPQSYLLRFARDELVDVVDRHNLRNHFTTGVGNALVQNHFNTVETDDGNALCVEDLFSQRVENDGISAIRRLIDDKRPAVLPGIRSRLSTFLAFQHIRGESSRSVILEQHKATMHTVLQTMTPEMLRAYILRTTHTTPSDEEVAELHQFSHELRRDQIGVSALPNLHFGTLLPIALDSIQYFYSRTWHILEFSDPLLITGDEPIGLVGKTWEPGEAIGLRTAAELVFATDPHHALVMVHPGKETDSETRHPGTPEMAKLINTHIAFGCHRHVVRCPGTDPLKGINLPKKAEPVGTFGPYVFTQQRLSAKNARAMVLRRIRSHEVAKKS